MVFVDSSVVIYYVEQPVTWGPKATARIAAVRAAGERLAVTELVRMECLVGPVRASDPALLADFAAFFPAPDVVVLPITASVAERAARVRAAYRFGPMDSLRLAAAVDSGCSLFLTNDAHLSGFPDVRVEILT
jgi:predicted nucleic acid-binding protein